ncbi:hypothetical protein [Paenibacillus antibioticophila]|nr:hypothetical protein [Paenibacillus antibioticophila]
MAYAANIGLETAQLEMMEELFKLGKPVVTVINSGRPLAIPLVIRAWP